MSSSEPIGARSTRVLIVSDDENNRFLLRMLLNLEDIEVVGEAVDALRAVPQALVHEPDVVILDYMTLGPRGVKTASMLRELFPSLHILSFSALMDGRPDWADAWPPSQEIPRVLQFVKHRARPEGRKK